MNCGTLRQKRAANALCALTLAALIAMGAAACGRPAADGSQGGSAASAFSAQTGDAAVDPENAEIAGESGVGVRAADLPAQTGRSNGIDVSKWQGKIDWQQVKAGGIEFAMIRIGYRGENGVIYKDDNADYNIQQAQKAGVPVGVYFFSTAVNDQVTAKDTVNLRTAATTKSELAGVLKNGETLPRVGIGANGWSKLVYNGRTVYAITSYLTTDLSFTAPREDVVAGNTFTPQNDRVTAKNEVNLRAIPSTDGEILGVLKSGEFLERTAVSNRGWSRLVYGGQTVYAVTSYLTDTPISQPETPAVPDDGFAPADGLVTAKSETNLRTAPSTDNSQVVYTLPNGEYVQRVGIHPNGWSKLIYNGQTVYAITSYLTE